MDRTKARVQASVKWRREGKQVTLFDLMHFAHQLVADDCEAENFLFSINEVVQWLPQQEVYKQRTDGVRRIKEGEGDAKGNNSGECKIKPNPMMNLKTVREENAGGNRNGFDEIPKTGIGKKM